MNIQIIAVGKIRENYIKTGIDEFLKRIQPYSSIKIVEIQAENLKYFEQEEKCKEIEAKKILTSISEQACVIAMVIKGETFSSENFARKIDELSLSGYNQLVFVIGGAVGLHKSVMDRADLKLSLSEMTMPHQMARLFLVEQIYRAFKIIKNEPYHK